MKAMSFVILFTSIGLILLYLYVIIMSETYRKDKKTNLSQSVEPINNTIEPMWSGAYRDPLTGKLKHFIISPHKTK